MRVAELWRYPVKGLRGEQLDQVEIGTDGIPGDRGLRVEDDRGVVTGRRKQRLVAVEATLGVDGETRIAGADWDSEAAAAAIREAGGEGARIVRSEGGHSFDAAPILLVTDGGIAQLGYDRRRFRPNLVIEGVEGPDEQKWVGRRIRVGQATILAEEACERCVITTIDPDTVEVDLEVLKRARAELGGLMGVYCSVIQPGTVKLGDPIEVV